MTDRLIDYPLLPKFLAIDLGATAVLAAFLWAIHAHPALAALAVAALTAGNLRDTYRSARRWRDRTGPWENRP